MREWTISTVTERRRSGHIIHVYIYNIERNVSKWDSGESTYPVGAPAEERARWRDTTTGWPWWETDEDTARRHSTEIGCAPGCVFLLGGWGLAGGGPRWQCWPKRRSWKELLSQHSEYSQKHLGSSLVFFLVFFLALPFLLTCIIATLEDVIFLYFVFALLPGIRWWCFFFIRVLSDLFFYLSTSTLFGSFDATRKKVTSDICRLRACARVYK